MMLYVDVLCNVYNQLRARLNVQPVVQQPWGLLVLIISSAVKGHRSAKLQQSCSTHSNITPLHRMCSTSMLFLCGYTIASF